jgi:hypothetical protein
MPYFYEELGNGYKIFIFKLINVFLSKNSETIS